MASAPSSPAVAHDPAACLPAGPLPPAPTAVLAQAQPSPTPTQLDRIEQKLDELLRRLDQRPPQASGVPPGAAPAPAAANPSPALPPAATAVPEAYKPGALAVARAAPADEHGLPDIPADGVGGFVYAGGPIPLTDIKSRGVRYAGPVGIELQGWLRAREAGRYQVGVDFTARFVFGASIAPACRLQAWLEGQSLDQKTILVTGSSKQDGAASLVLGAELQPGLYRLRLWTACTVPQNVVTTAEILLKAPSELNLRPVTANDLVHKER